MVGLIIFGVVFISRVITIGTAISNIRDGPLGKLFFGGGGGGGGGRGNFDPQ